MPHTADRWTAAMVRELPDDRNRYEVIDGELCVTPAPSAAHQRALGSLYIHLSSYLRGQTWGEVLFAPADISFRDDMLVQPDLFVLPIDAGARRPGRWAEVRGLLLAVEVLSPSTARADRQLKRRLYQREGVGEYWIVDLDARVIERWRSTDQRPEIVADTLTWQPKLDVPGFAIDLRTYFREVLET
jgi:Uma2 family endonuclease